MAKDAPDVLKLIFQLDSLQRNVTPLLAPVGQKLVSDLLSTGVKPAKIAKIIGRAPTYAQAVATGAKSLSAANIVAIVTHAARSAEVTRAS